MQIDAIIAHLQMNVEGRTEIEKLTKSLRMLNEELGRTEKDTLAYQQATKKLSTVQRVASEHSRTLGKTTDKLGRITDDTSKEFKEYNAQLKRADKNLTGISTQSTKAGKSITSIGVGAGAAFVAFQALDVVIDQFKDATRVTKEFEVAIDNLSAITGATGKDLEFYEQQAKEIGRTTSLSASQAVEAFKLIGSNKPELLGNAEALSQVTKQAVILAEAAKLQLPEAANVVTTSLNQFGASADDTAKFIDILATSQRKGAASIPLIGEALKNAGSSANAAGLSFEETNVALQALAQGGIKGAEAGTQLSSLLVKLSTQTDKSVNPSLRSFQEVVNQLSARNLTLADATKLVGAESAKALLTIVKQKSVVDELSGSLNVQGAALEQARINTDNLDGDLKRLNSAFEALQLQVGKKSNPAIRAFIQFVTRLISNLEPLRKIAGQIGDVFARLFREVESLLKGFGLFNEEADLATYIIGNFAQVGNLVLGVLDFLVTGFEKLSQGVKVTVATFEGLSDTFEAVTKEIKEAAIATFDGLGDILAGNFEEGRKKLEKSFEGFGEDSSTAFQKGYERRMKDFDLPKKTAEIVEEGTKANKQKINQAGGNLAEQVVKPFDKKAKKIVTTFRNTVKELEFEARQSAIDGQENSALKLINQAGLDIDMAIDDVKARIAKFKELGKQAGKTDAEIQIGVEAIEEIYKGDIKGIEQQLKNELSETFGVSFEGFEVFRTSLEKALNDGEKLKTDGFTNAIREAYIKGIDLGKKKTPSLLPDEKPRQELIKETGESIKARQKANDKANKENKKSDEESIQERKDAFKQFYQDLVGFANESINNQISKLDEQISASRTRIDSLREQDDEASRQQLVEEEKRQEQLIKRRERFAQAQKIIAAGEAAVNIAVGISKAFAESGATAPVTLPIILGAVGAALAGIPTLISSLSGFKDGVIDFQGEGTATSDSNVVRISRGESVITAKGTRLAPKTLEMINEGRIGDQELFNGSLSASLPRVDALPQVTFPSSNTYLDTKQLEQKVSDLTDMVHQLVIKTQSPTFVDYKFDEKGFGKRMKKITARERRSNNKA